MTAKYFEEIKAIIDNSFVSTERDVFAESRTDLVSLVAEYARVDHLDLNEVREAAALIGEKFKWEETE